MAIAIDAMGGDFGLSVPVAGAIQASEDFGTEIILVGFKSEVEAELKRHTYDPKKIHIQDCTEVVEMHESPAQAIRQKKDSSIRVALDLHKKGDVDAVVSAGHSGAAMATAKYVLKAIKHIDRPAIAAIMPSVKKPYVILDMGANTDCKPEYLVQFAFMGDAYARCIFDVPSPRVGLLNNGEEEGKGNILVKETYDLLKQSSLNFTGNIEGKAMFHGEADVIVCDGFVGNITLKVAEGTFDFIQSVLREEVSKSMMAKLGYLGMKNPFQALKRRADYNELGGAPLLGVRGVVIICHGSSNSRTIRNAVRNARNCVKQDLHKMIAKEIADNASLLKAANTTPVAQS